MDDRAGRGRLRWVIALGCLVGVAGAAAVVLVPAFRQSHPVARPVVAPRPSGQAASSASALEPERPDSHVAATVVTNLHEPVRLLNGSAARRQLYSYTSNHSQTTQAMERVLSLVAPFWSRYVR